MSISLLQTVEAPGSSSNPRTVTISSTAAGSLIVVQWTSNSIVSVSSITDNMGNTYVHPPSVQGTYNDGSYLATSDIWYSHNSTAGVTSIVLNFTGSVNSAVVIQEFSGVKIASSPVDISSNNNAVSMTPSNLFGPSLTTTVPNDLLISTCISNISIFTVSSPWNFEAMDGRGAAYTIQNLASTYQAQFEPPSTTGLFASSGVAFKEEPGISRVQNASINDVLSVSISPSTANNTLVVSIGANNVNSALVTSVTDDAGNVYTQVSGAQGAVSTNTLITDLWTCLSCLAGATTITIHLTGGASDFGGGFWSITVAEYSGISTIETAAQLSNQSGTAVGPVLTNANSGDLLFSVISTTLGTDTGGIAAPWNNIFDGFRGTSGDYLPGTTGSFQATTPKSAQYCSSGIIFAPLSLILTLNLSDSVVASDSTVEAFYTAVSDVAASSDTFPQSIAIQSDFLAVTNTPTVETLVNQLVPASVKTYFRIEE